ncbi:MAG TPA: hypothetical protein VG433_13185, partial [Pirellulales bacterium]|nr:hypothetical protein [Pirellulales bacterium]
ELLLMYRPEARKEVLVRYADTVAFYAQQAKAAPIVAGALFVIAVVNALRIRARGHRSTQWN